MNFFQNHIVLASLLGLNFEYLIVLAIHADESHKIQTNPRRQREKEKGSYTSPATETQQQQGKRQKYTNFQY